MDNKINGYYWVVVFLTILPPIFSIFFGISGLEFPAYLFASLLALASIMRTFNGKILPVSLNKSSCFILFFLLWLIYGSQYSISTEASTQKVVSITYLIVIPLLLIEIGNIFLLRFKNVNFKFSLYSPRISKLSIAIIFVSLILFSEIKDGRVVLPGLNNSIWISRHLGLLIIIVFFYNLKNNTFGKWNVIFTTIGVIAMFIVGSRTPFISLIFCLLIIRFKHNSILKNILFLLVSTLIVYFFSKLFSSSYLFETNFFSFFARQDFYNFIKDSSFDFSKGIGTGGFGMFYTGYDENLYPHNIFLEIFVENGVIGIILFSIIMINYFKNIKIDLIFMLALYTFINSLTSGDIPGNNLFFIFLYLSSKLKK